MWSVPVVSADDQVAACHHAVVLKVRKIRLAYSPAFKQQINEQTKSFLRWIHSVERLLQLSLLNAKYAH